MWYLCSKFNDEQTSKKVYEKLQPKMFSHNIDMSVYRFVLSGIWHIVAINDYEPEPRIVKEAYSYLNQGVITQLPQGVLNSFLERRGSNINKAQHKTPTGKYYESHTATPLNYVSDTPITEGDIEATYAETSRYLNKLNDVKPTQPYHKELPPSLDPAKPFLVQFMDAEYTDSSLDTLILKSGMKFTSKQDESEAIELVHLCGKVQMDRIRHSQKYLFTRSAMKLHESVFHPQIDMPLQLPPMTVNTWVELQDAISTPYGDIKAVYVNDAYPVDSIDRVAPTASMGYMHEVLLETFGVHTNQWSLDIVRPNLRLLYDLTFDVETKEWVYLASHICPWGACKYKANRVSLMQTLVICTPCQKCIEANNFFSHWVATALDIINMRYATTPEPEPFKTEIQTYKTQALVSVGKGKNKHKINQTVERNIAFTIVDVSIKKPVPIKEESEHTGNWLTMHGSEDIIYELRHVPATTRNLDPSRNARWKTAREVGVKAHQKYVPMLKDGAMKIHKVVASQYTNKA